MLIVTKEICCCIAIHCPDKEKTMNVKNNNIINKQRSMVSFLFEFFYNVKTLFATRTRNRSLVYFSSGEIGENSSFALFGFRTPVGIVIGYIIGYILSAFRPLRQY